MKFCKVLLNGEVLFSKARMMETFFERLSGLMFKKNIGCNALVFKDCASIHSFFCIVIFNALFIGKDGKILNHFTKIPKNKILPSVFGAKYLIEYLNERVYISDNDFIDIVEL